MNLTDRTTAALAWIDAQIAICEAATDGPWNEQYESKYMGACMAVSAQTSTSYTRIADIKNPANAAFIATARTGYPATLRALRTAIGGYDLIAGLDWTNSLDSILTTLESLK